MADAPEEVDQPLTAPLIIHAWMENCKESLKTNRTKSLEVTEVNPLIWASLDQVFLIDPKTLHELLMLKPSSCTKFMRELEPGMFHWHGTTFTFMNLGLLKALWRTDKVAVQTIA